tara:strand:- start:705 stop:896 length:192 start_codon:yes stop_codon:yes gene_type:complete
MKEKVLFESGTQCLTLYRDGVNVGINGVTNLRHFGLIEKDFAFTNQYFGGATRANTGLGNIFL